jgi:hypothetical protein
LFSEREGRRNYFTIRSKLIFEPVPPRSICSAISSVDDKEVHVIKKRR